MLGIMVLSLKIVAFIAVTYQVAGPADGHFVNESGGCLTDHTLPGYFNTPSSRKQFRYRVWPNCQLPPFVLHVLHFFLAGWVQPGGE